MAANDGYNEFELFVNDKFNWQNANFKLVKGDSEYDLKRKTEGLYWLMKESESPYSINSMGYRTDEFLEQRDLVFAGCSQTWGDGVVYDGIWGNILSKSLGIKSYNLGLGGKSTQFIVQNLIAFFKQYGNPKMVFCLFPEFTRMEMKSSADFMISKNSSPGISGKNTYSLIPIAVNPNKNTKYSKMPHIAEEMIPLELAFSISLDYINMLELYCKLYDIKLFWGTWDPFQDKYLNENIDSMDFENYVYLSQEKWEKRIQDDYINYFHEDGILCSGRIPGPCTTHNTCHEELKEIYGKNFNFSMDSDPKNKIWGHIPVHTHIHIAEYFERALKNDSN